MSTATDQDTRLFRFGAIVPEEHQELALRLAELEDRLNEAFAEEELNKLIYFIPTIVDALSVTPSSIEQAEDHLTIRLEVLPDYEALVQSFVSALRESEALEEDWLVKLEQALENPSED